ncbi:MAG: glycosyl transferase, partial [Actinomycetota bacterium]|nr:glycosyl transferase [Actinomycetota bacterium]
MLQPILFVTSNGAGLGHLTRSMAIARRLPAGLQPLFLTLSQALPVVRGQGFLAEYLFSAGYAGTDRRRWNPLFEQRLCDVIDQYHPAAVIFDGTYPYLGLISVLRARPDLPFVWCRRAMWRPNTGGDNLRYSSLFELILEPGEFAAEMDRGLTTSHRYQAVSVPPILYCDESELLPRPVAEQELGLKPDR